MTLTRHSDNLWSFKDTCNVYILKSGDECLLIDSGSGAVTDYLADIGVRSVSWVLHTHHHRDQCWGTAALQDAGAKVAVPEYERHLFDNVEAFWQGRRIYDNYNNQNTFFSLGESIHVDALLEDYDTFRWKEFTFRILPAKGHTYGMIALIVEVDGARVAFTGDLMTKGGNLYQLHAMEYHYGDHLGIEFTMQSILALKKQDVAVAYPSHGAPCDAVEADIVTLEGKLEAMSRLGAMSTSGRPTRFKGELVIRESRLERISEHLLWGGPYTCSNFYILLSGEGHAMFIDYGLASWGHLHMSADHDGLQLLRFVEHHLDQLREDFGVETIELILPTHIHDDHVAGIPFLQAHFGTQCWALDCVAAVIENPAAWASTPCCFHKPVRVDRVLRDGERFSWRGYDFDVYYAPGQTEYHSFLVAQIDGQRVAFGGDNLFTANSDSLDHDGEILIQSTVMRNSFQLGMHQLCADVLRRTNPDVVCPGHGFPIEMDEAQTEGYLGYIDEKERLFRALVDTPADHFIDLFWARMLPYMAEVSPGDEVTYTVKLRNNLERAATFGARLLLPSGWPVVSGASSDPVSVLLDAGQAADVTLVATMPVPLPKGRTVLTAEILIDGASQGPICEAIVVHRSAPSQ